MAKASSLQRVADYLATHVGVGHRFTMEQIRQTIPAVNQVDRRMRELRECGWVIHSNRDDPQLALHEYLLVSVGGTTRPRRPSDRTRREVFDRGQHRCQVCGIGSGEPYADNPTETAQLTLGHWVPQGQGGDPLNPGNLRAECSRCNSAIQHGTGAVATPESVWARIEHLPRSQKRELLSWASSGRRSQPDAELLWYEWRQLPPVAQEKLAERLRRAVGNRGS